MRAGQQEVVDYRGLAALEEARVAAAFRRCADASEPLAGGVMCRGAPGLWINAAIGAGLIDGASLDAMRAEVSRLIGFYEGHAIEPRVEVCPFVAPPLVEALAERGFVVRLFENVFCRRLTDVDQLASERGRPAGLTIDEIDAGDAALAEEYARLSLEEFLPPGETPTEERMEGVRRAIRAPGVRAFLARSDGTTIGVGAVEIAGEVAALIGAAVRAPHRGRGVQGALIARRLEAACRAGARWATVTSRPGVATERNAQRAGFSPAYTRTVLVRPRPGLAPVVE